MTTLNTSYLNWSFVGDLYINFLTLDYVFKKVYNRVFRALVYENYNPSVEILVFLCQIFSLDHYYYVENYQDW